MSLVKDLYAVFKLRIGFAIALTAIAGLMATPGAAPEAWRVAVLALAVLISAGSAGALNHYVERDLDALMARTRGRPFVTGTFRGRLYSSAPANRTTRVPDTISWNPWNPLLFRAVTKHNRIGIQLKS